MLEVDGASRTLGGMQIIDDVSVRFKPGHLSVIIGPNGSGKTTLLRMMSGELKPTRGLILYDGKAIAGTGMEALARKRAVLSQSSDLSFPLTVDEVVMMGRYPHFVLKPSRHDEEVCGAAIAAMGIDQIRGRNYLTLSGGEKHMVHFARVLAQIWIPPEDHHRYLLLDEPTAFLDINHQHLFLKMAKGMAERDTVVVAVLHDILLAAQYADFIVALRNGRKIAEGDVDSMITPGLFRDLYGMNGKIFRGDGMTYPIIVF